MIYLLDTNMVSYIVKRRSMAATNKLFNLDDDDIAALSVITTAEIHYGFAKKPQGAAFRSLMESFLASVQVISWGMREAEIYGSIRAKLEKNGVALGGMDMMIAAHAITAGATLVTNDKAFSQIKEIPMVVNWATDL